MSSIDYQTLMKHARDRHDLATLAFAGAVALASASARRPLIRKLSEAQFADLLATHFPGVELENGDDAVDNRIDEFDDLLCLLREYQVDRGESTTWLCYVIASASMGDNHLWQDLGLPSRQVLSALMQRYFPGLKALNAGDMKWKKFFYRQLCERAEVFICKSPNCAICTDYPLCFGPEDSASAPSPELAVGQIESSQHS